MRKLIWLLGAFVAIVAGYLYSTLPDLEGRKRIPGLIAPVVVISDNYAIPSINAENRLDAFSALGFVTARDRMFQLELFRRAAQGRLAEIFGPTLVPMDRRQRVFDFTGTAKKILKQLPLSQQQSLLAYSLGINAYLEQNQSQPFEFVLLGFEPSPWTPEDSILVAMNLFQALNFTSHKEAMLSIMNRCLPKEVVAFITPDSDRYSQTLVGGQYSRRPQRPIPHQALRTLYKLNHSENQAGFAIKPSELFGSNGWVVSGNKTADGRAILANDMHLPLLAPNIWYRAKIRYKNNVLSGITLPGLPIVVSGTNRHVAWGYTNALADVIDLVTLETNPENENEYLGPQGWMTFVTTNETIHVRGSDDIDFQTRQTLWGPVSNRGLLGKPTAIRWTALDPNTVDLGLIELDQAKTLEDAFKIFNRAGLPVLNVMLADSQGSIGWTLTGKIPKRQGFDGSISQDWANSAIGWKGYVLPNDLPRIKNPESGYIVTANNRIIGKNYPYPIGHNFANGYRASRIRHKLASMDNIKENDMLKLQSDSRSGFYDFYHDLAISVLNDQTLKDHPQLSRIKNYLSAWNGSAHADSYVFGVLFRFRRKLAGEIILPLLKPCYLADKRFYYSWFNMDTPLRQILSARSPEILPDPEAYRSWDEFILKVLIKTVSQLENEHNVQDINRLVWSDINPVRIAHPFTRAVPFLAKFLDLPLYPMSGCTFCINVMAESYGVTERFIVSPGHPEDALLHMPGGQSGNPLSKHYDDQHIFWAKLRAMPLEPKQERYRLWLTP